jgi:uncharacterized protein (DUF433 family)
MRNWNLLTLLVLLSLNGCVTHHTVAAPPVEPISVANVIEMKRSGASDETILQVIRSHRVPSRLSPEDVVAMKDAGVTDHVIDAMMEAPREEVIYYDAPRRTYRDTHTYDSHHHWTHRRHHRWHYGYPRVTWRFGFGYYYCD